MTESTPGIVLVGNSKSSHSPHKDLIINHMRNVDVPPGTYDDSNRDVKSARKLVARDLLLERVRMENVENKYRATYDLLTGHKRQDLFDDALKHQLDALKTGRTTEIINLNLDLDYFSHFNDAFASHRFGDIGIQAFSKIISRHLRISDETFWKKGDDAFRKGGEEFVILMEEPRKHGQFNIQELTNRIKLFMVDVKHNMLNEIFNEIQSEDNLEVVERFSRNGKRFKDRFGSLALREISRNILHTKQSGDLEKIIYALKGTLEQKTDMISIVHTIDNDLYSSYSSDDRSWEELTEDDKSNRRKQEKNIVNDLSKIFRNRSVSAGLFILPQSEANDITKHTSIQDRSDTLLYDSKHSGRSRLTYQHGLHGDKHMLVIE